MTSIEIDNETGELLLFVNRHFANLKKLEELGALDSDVIMFVAYKNKFGAITAVDNTRREVCGNKQVIHNFRLTCKKKTLGV